jgi:hypothetical protein
VLDADIRNLFGQIANSWLRRFVEHRISDKRTWRLIDKWLTAGVIEDRRWSACWGGSAAGIVVRSCAQASTTQRAFDVDLICPLWLLRQVFVAFPDTANFRFRTDSPPSPIVSSAAYQSIMRISTSNTIRWCYAYQTGAIVSPVWMNKCCFRAKTS